MSLSWTSFSSSPIRCFAMESRVRIWEAGEMKLSLKGPIFPFYQRPKRSRNYIADARRRIGQYVINSKSHAMHNPLKFNPIMLHPAIMCPDVAKRCLIFYAREKGTQS
ncbi:MAG: hypothetical protein COX20_01510 [Desulfobacterales bacterium CG23_combo_of_CG06-09_8_20_14_all_52_9]|nr:MAG: hypothetical protein COX20_01510 [Desulfobacterales bacterium CG23_combo_of_CG06-09_8_20_14_all_52_9]